MMFHVIRHRFHASVDPARFPAILRHAVDRTFSTIINLSPSNLANGFSIVLRLMLVLP
jgi:hypothetical protein